MRREVLLVAMLMGCAVPVSGPTSQACGDDSPRTYVWTLEAPSEMAGVVGAMTAAGVVPERTLPRLGALVFEATPSLALLLRADYGGWLDEDGVALLDAASPMTAVPRFAINDVEPFGWQRVGVREAWSSLGGARGYGTGVAVIGDGIDAAHVDLVDAVVASASFAGDAVPGHAATHAAGVIAAAENDLGTIGIAVDARLWSADVVSGAGEGSVSSVLAGLEWAVGERVDVALVLPAVSAAGPAVCKAFARAAAAGVLVVVPAGDVSEWSAAAAPNGFAGCADVLVVSAADEMDFAPSFAPVDERIALVAPGTFVLGPVPGGGWTTRSGTGAAAAYVAGAAAVLVGRFPLLGPAPAADMLRRAADDIGEPGTDPVLGAGMLDLPGALRMALPGWNM
jgi:subtilisin family serine protease